LSIGEDKVTKDATEALFKKHPDTSIIATLDEQGKLVWKTDLWFLFQSCRLAKSRYSYFA
jgi:hypothetical protein